ncbi:MAG: glycine betaine ABC transporter substrate-binding protein [Isosphaeraceae bacterium]
MDAAAMRQMNREVDQEGKKPEEVAHGFLRRKGLLLED